MEQKQLIINEAIREFLAFGVDLKLSDIAKNIGISKKTIYRYFKNKEDLLKSSVDSFFFSVHEEQNKINNDKSINDLEKLKRIMIAMPKDINNFNVTLLSDLNKQYPEIYKRVNHYLESDWDLTLNLLNKCKEEKLVINIDENIFRAMFIGCAEQIIELSNLNMDFDDVQEQMINVLIGGIKRA